ncbi:MAG: tetratricopeptide (TPR) repeat protein [Candidatus Azotimanducaceae bacterium]|jgi:tetratricopeptide (TPR) repeat protein
MAIQLGEGQSFAAEYSLLHKLDSSEAWLALHEPTQERVRIALLDSSAVSALAQLRQNVERAQSLVHPNLLRTYRISDYEGQLFVVAEYKKGLIPLDLSGPFKETWPALKTLIGAIQYGHSLGFHHGKISPERLLVDSYGVPYLDGFGLPADPDAGAYLAPEAQGANQHTSSSSDIYSMAQVLYRAMTGSSWTAGQNNSDVPLEDSIQHFLQAMLASSEGDRPNDFSSLITLVEESAVPSQPVSATTFERAIEPPLTETGAASAAASNANARAANQFHKLPRERNVISTPIAVMGLAILIVLGLGLFLLLPETANKAVNESGSKAESVTAAETSSSAQPASPVVDAAADIAPLALAKLEALRVQGKTLAAELLRLQVEVEDVGGRLWAGERYEESTNLGIAGDEAYRANDLQMAVDKYAAGIALLENVLTETEQVFDENLQRGISALDIGDYKIAIEAYKIITRIKPADVELAIDLERALNLEQVLRLTAEAEVTERNGDLSAALKTFSEASSLDALWTPASEGVRRINNRIARNRFQDEMSQGFTALTEEDFDGARDAFEQAQKILPGSKEPLDGLQQIELAKTQKNIFDLTAEAESLETASRWQDAIPVLEQILEISPGLSSVELSLQRVRERAELNVALDSYVSQPHLMQDDVILANAKAALLKAARLNLDGLKGQVRDLSHLVSLARIEVNVILSSDNRTDVTVYKVGQYGKISEVQLSLIPGIYTFVGKRSGYRDVYQEIHIKGDTNPVRIELSCTEKI